MSIFYFTCPLMNVSLRDFTYSNVPGLKIRILVYIALLLLTSGAGYEIQAAKFVGVDVLDKDYLVVHLLDGEVIHTEGAIGESIIRYTPELNTDAVIQTSNWNLTSLDDDNYSTDGQPPQTCYRKTKLNGHAQLEWSGNDYNYEYTYEHLIYLKLPTSLQQGMTYTLNIAPATNSDTTSYVLTFDIFNNRSKALHVNLVGYMNNAIHKAADLYHWMGNGGSRNYSNFEGSTVYVYNVNTQQSYPAGIVAFWMASQSDVGGYNLTQTDVWNVDFSSFTFPGTYRLVVEGIGCSEDFEIANDIYATPFKVAIKGYYYMRIGEDNPTGISPPPRTPLYIPSVNPVSTIVYLTTMHPWHPDWNSFSSGDRWDRPNDWASYRLSGNPSNLNAWGGHSDAADWDRQDYFHHPTSMPIFYFKNILTQPGTGTTCCASARLGAYFSSLIIFHTFLDKKHLPIYQ